MFLSSVEPGKYKLVGLKCDGGRIKGIDNDIGMLQLHAYGTHICTCGYGSITLACFVPCISADFSNCPHSI
jgi:hypothetical protein